MVILGAFAACTANKRPAKPVVVVAAAGEVARGPVDAALAPSAEPAPEEVDVAALNALLPGCTGVDEPYPLGAVASAERVAALDEGRVFLARMTAGGDKRVLMFDPRHRSSSCPAFVLGPGVARASGDYLGEGAPREVELLSQADDGVPCSSDACSVALVIRDPAGVVLAAVDPSLDCETYTLKTVRLFADRDSIELRCNSFNVNTMRGVHLFHVFGRALRPLLGFNASIIDVSLTEDEKRVCTSRSKNGGYKITARGASPVVEVVAMTELREATRTRWAFSAAEQRMVPGTPVRKQLPAPPARCEPAG